MYRATLKAPVPLYNAEEQQIAETGPPIICAPATPTCKDDRRAYNLVSWNVLSDTVTLPTSTMRACMASAVCGDEGYKTDEPTKLLERTVAQLAGKEAALFCASGTQANQLAIHAHLARCTLPSAVICDFRAHIHACEMGGIAYHSRGTTVPLMPRNQHHLTLKDIQTHCESHGSTYATRVQVISLENTLQGMIFPHDEVQRIATYAREHGIMMHLDGARLWNAMAETRMSLAELCAPFDTVSLCLSKGIGAPVGTILAGSQAMIEHVRCLRKLFGGMMRQTGVLAAAAHQALHENFQRLFATHVLARRVAARLQERGARITVPVETNMVFFDVPDNGPDMATLQQRAASLDPPIRIGHGRLVVHYMTNPSLPERLASLLAT